jgi:hypothetical protein
MAYIGSIGHARVISNAQYRTNPEERVRAFELGVPFLKHTFSGMRQERAKIDIGSELGWISSHSLFYNGPPIDRILACKHKAPRWGGKPSFSHQ